MKYNDDVAKLNPEPTDLQRAIWRRHHAAGTSPGNPKWYKPSKLPAPFVFKPGAAPVYPRLPTGAAWNAKHSPNSAKHQKKSPCVTSEQRGGFKP